MRCRGEIQGEEFMSSRFIFSRSWVVIVMAFAANAALATKTARDSERELRSRDFLDEVALRDAPRAVEAVPPTPA